jgi:hypothetical protein
MNRVIALSIAFATAAMPVALAAGPINTAGLTCKELVSSGHDDMVAMTAAMYEAVKNDPKFSSLSADKMWPAEDRACTKHPDAKVIDALRADN